MSALGNLRVFAIVTLVAGFARADAIPRPKQTCPEGAVATSSHSGEWCEIQDCTTDTDCAQQGRVCRDTPLCVELRTGPSGARAPSMTSGPSSYRTVVGSCAGGATCTYPAECSTSSKRCVRSGLIERTRATCGCSIPGLAGDDGWALFGAFSFALALAARRRDRRPGVNPSRG